MKTLLEQEFDDLSDIKAIIENKNFQKFIVEDFNQELEKLKASYDCDSLRELATVKGKKQGLMHLFKVLKHLDTEYKNKRFELEAQAE